MPWEAQLILWACAIVAFVALPVFGWWEFYGRDWLRMRRTIRLARSYGIECVPGEDLDKLRDRIIAKRDKLL